MATKAAKAAGAAGATMGYGGHRSQRTDGGRAWWAVVRLAAFGWYRGFVDSAQGLTSEQWQQIEALKNTYAKAKVSGIGKFQASFNAVCTLCNLVKVNGSRYQVGMEQGLILFYRTKPDFDPVQPFGMVCQCGTNRPQMFQDKAFNFSGHHASFVFAWVIFNLLYGSTDAPYRLRPILQWIIFQNSCPMRTQSCCSVIRSVG